MHAIIISSYFQRKYVNTQHLIIALRPFYINKVLILTNCFAILELSWNLNDFRSLLMRLFGKKKHFEL